MNFTLHEIATEIDGNQEVHIVAMSGLQLVGTVTVGMLNRRSACFKQLFVHKRYRSQGIGTALVNRCCDIARKHKCETIGLSLACTNGATEAFYNKLGFKFGYAFSDESLLVKWL